MAGKKKGSVEKTKVGHEYRARGPKGKLKGEYETKKKAKKKVGKSGKKR